MKSPLVYIIQFLVLCAASLMVPVLSVSAEKLTVKQQMDKVYVAYQQLFEYATNEEDFLSKKNDRDIKQLLTELRVHFNGENLIDSKYESDPGYSATLDLVKDLLDDIQYRFNSGNKRYALWRMRALPDYCISCHSRFKVSSDFTGVTIKDKSLTPLEQAEFYFATRQFQKASEQFMKVARAEDAASDRILSLRKWLLIYTRVYPDPSGALRELNKIRKDIDLAPYEDEEIYGWIQSLRRWKNEGSSVRKQSNVRRAENLINQGLQMEDSKSDGSGLVELLRATSMLHALLQNATLPKEERGHVTYLLGKAYSNLPQMLAHELPGQFLQECIREYPGTKDARRCYNLYQRNMVVQFSGSAGTSLPDDVKLELRELYKLAYEIPEPPSRI